MNTVVGLGCDANFCVMHHFPLCAPGLYFATTKALDRAIEGAAAIGSVRKLAWSQKIESRLQQDA
jgi:hypothetical protein